jgi:hypothetical protein
MQKQTFLEVSIESAKNDTLVTTSSLHCKRFHKNFVVHEKTSKSTKAEKNTFTKAALCADYLAYALATETLNGFWICLSHFLWSHFSFVCLY